MFSENKNGVNQKTQGIVVATNVAAIKGEPRSNKPLIEINNLGVVGDVHAGFGHRQVSLVPIEVFRDFEQRTGKEAAYGYFGENIIFSGIDVSQFAVLDRLQINDVILEITQVGEKCHGDVCDVYHEVGGVCLKSQQGLFARVVNPGKIAVGDKIIYLPYVFKVLIITLSDRASAGVYEDKSGKIALQMLTQFFDDKNWRCQFEQVLLPDDSEQLLKYLQRAVINKVDFIFTLGGTGVGARDITPETVMQICEKTIPGIMEHIRYKYGAQHPAALLSRSIACVSGITQIYTLPGSTRAVSEYLTEIFCVLEHIVCMLRGIDRH